MNTPFPKPSLLIPHVLWLSTILLGLCAGAADLPRTKFSLTPAQMERLQQSLAPLHDNFDPAERMLHQPFSSPGYHTTLKGGMVHSTRSSLNYAVALLDTGEERWRVRAEEILSRVIALQDQDPASKTYGIWSWFAEEPLTQMSPPDWNWADFCGVALLQVALDHRDRLSPDLLAQVDAAIKHAARSIQKRNVGPGYTNIAIMGAYVTLVAAELYDMADLREYALKRWRGFYDYTQHHGAFTEYNSPTYTIVALKELARMRRHVQHPEARKLTEEIYRLAWLEIARHFHAPSRQWAGPHSRAYSSLLRPDVLSTIQRATQGRLLFGTDQPSMEEHRLALDCPRELESFFTALSEPREVVQTFLRAEPPVVGTTYLHPAFALGSINRGDLWNQRRSLLAYWGTASRPSYLHLRMLHDGYDFAAAQFFSVQRQGNVLAGINFAVDGGDRHVSLDRLKQGTFRARDLRLRFEIGGEAGKLKLRAPHTLSESMTITDGEIRLTFTVPWARLGTNHGRWEAGQDSSKSWLDVVLYAGEERTFVLPEISPAAIGLAISIASGEMKVSSVTAVMHTNHLAMRWDSLALELPVVPARAQELHRACLLR